MAEINDDKINNSKSNREIQDIFGNSTRVLIIQVFLNNPDKYMNANQIASIINKNPVTVVRKLPKLTSNQFIKEIQVGKRIKAFKLNLENKKNKLLLKFLADLKLLNSTK